MGFNVYTEADKLLHEVMDWAQGNDYTREELDAKDFMELYNEYVDQTNADYEYSVYNADLFQAIIDDMNLLGYCEEVEAEIGQGIASEPTAINEAIRNYIFDTIDQDVYDDALETYFPEPEESERRKINGLE